ncbi:MAG: autotransporter-associated beta strand repeat-containing protein, partial [Akkermansia sp.]
PTQFGVGDRAIFDSTGAASQTISILGIVLSKGITVSGSTNYTFSGSGNFVGDKMTLVKDGTGKLTISTNNDRLSNSITTVNQGTLLLTSVNALGKGGSLTVNTGATVQTEGTALGILSGQTIDINGGGAVAFNATSDMTLSGGITGAGDIRKSGGSNLFITGTNNNFAGTLRLQGGITVVGAANTSSGGADATLGANANIIVESGASFRTHLGGSDKTFNFANAYIKSGGSFGNIDGNVNETGNLHFNVESIGTDGVITYNAIGTSTLYQHWAKKVGLNGIISGQGTVNVIAEHGDGGSDHRFILRNAGNTFNGVYNLASTNKSTIELAISDTATGGVAKTASFTLGHANATLAISASAVTIAGLAGTAGKVQSEGAGEHTLTINQALDTEFSGIIGEATGGGTMGIVKDGVGSLTLSGANT